MFTFTTKDGTMLSFTTIPENYIKYSGFFEALSKFPTTSTETINKSTEFPFNLSQLSRLFVFLENPTRASYDDLDDDIKDFFILLKYKPYVFITADKKLLPFDHIPEIYIKYSQFFAKSSKIYFTETNEPIELPFELDELYALFSFLNSPCMRANILCTNIRQFFELTQLSKCVGHTHRYSRVYSKKNKRRCHSSSSCSSDSD